MTIEDARRRRTEKALALAALENGQVTLSQTLRDPPDVLRTADLWDVLLSTPSLGKKGARRLCQDAGVWPLTSLGSLSPLDLESLLHNLPDRVRGDEDAA